MIRDLPRAETGLDDIDQNFRDLRQSFKSGRTKSLNWRKKQLEQLIKMCDEQQDLLASAAHKDFQKPETETILFDCVGIRNECVNMLNHIDEWASDEKRSDAISFAAMEKYVHPEPLGIALIIGAWNYPYLVTLTPLVGAIAAGNCAIVKPSELASNAASTIAVLIDHYLDKSCIRVVLGGVEQTQALLRGDIDKIFYTGSTSIGKVILRAAAEKMIPVTLECGGKSPVYVADDANIEIGARRIAWGKVINCGQTCLAPDYILCSKETESRLVPAIIRAWREFFTETPSTSYSYGRIVNERHFERIRNLLDSKKIIYGGDIDPSTNYISPTIMTNVTGDDRVMQEEIFGPILPFITVNSEEEAIDFINARDKPLALYIFSSNRKLINFIIDSTSAGSTCVNDVIFQVGPLSLPFGGVGASGLGSYHGKYSFEAFSHLRTVVYMPNWAESLLAKRNPPYDKQKTNFLCRCLRMNRHWLSKQKISYIFKVFVFAMTVFGVYASTR